MNGSPLFTRYFSTKEYLEVRDKLNFNDVWGIQIVHSKGNHFIKVSFLDVPNISSNYLMMKNKSRFIRKY